jgi:type VI protein secretion system component VasK
MEPEKKSYGALIGAIIIIVILIIGGIYFWQARIKSIELQKQMQAEAIRALQEEELDILQNDLNNTDINIDLDIEKLK